MLVCGAQYYSFRAFSVLTLKLVCLSLTTLHTTFPIPPLRRWVASVDWLGPLRMVSCSCGVWNSNKLITPGHLVSHIFMSSNENFVRRLCCVMWPLAGRCGGARLSLVGGRILLIFTDSSIESPWGFDSIDVRPSGQTQPT
ncbi:hypothetical protein BD779DRAFT_1495263 [Infundibulicybe gibba]|nr:hypothetical protein BD779DRAFT_1495263 [Infundibulicybe gibba]